MRKLASIAISIILLASMLAIIAPTKASETGVLPDYEAVDWQSGLAGAVTSMPTMDDALAAAPETVQSFASTPPVGTVVWDWYLWAISSSDYGGPKAYMTLRAMSGNVEVWVQNDMRFPFNATYSDPRNANPIDFTVTDEMAQYLADTFNSIIYPTDTTYFGTPFNRDGSGAILIGRMFPTAPANWWYWITAPDNPQRVILKILNYRDQNYYDPTFPSYVAGFYQATYTRSYYKRNMIHIDPWQFWRRLGNEGTHWFPDTTVPASRANLYEATVAHEFQHNIHRDYNPNDDTFMNEGSSEFAQILCGWPNTLWSHINNFLYTPDNSLTVWNDQGDYNTLADYGAAALWTMYLGDHYGGADFIRHFVQAGIPGIAGVNAALEYFGYTQRFDDVFHDWRIANLIHSNLVADSRYTYKTLDLGSASARQASRFNVSGLPVPWTTGTSFGPTWSLTGYNTGVTKLGPYSTDYIVMNHWDQSAIVGFDGDDVAVYGWTFSSGAWFSGAYNMLNALLYGDAYVDPLNPTLTLVTKYSTEVNYDYGFVQVSTDGGNTWVSLSNAYTTSAHASDAMPAIVAYLPGLNGKSSGYPNWMTMTFDLTAYAGQTVQIGFRYMTDPATLGPGWYIQDAQVSGASMALNPAYPGADFQVSVVRVYVENGQVINYLVNDVILNGTTETGAKGANILEPDYVILVVSYVTPFGLVDYQFQAKTLPVIIHYSRLVE